MSEMTDFREPLNPSPGEDVIVVIGEMGAWEKIVCIIAGAIFIGFVLGWSLASVLAAQAAALLPR